MTKFWMQSKNGITEPRFCVLLLEISQPKAVQRHSMHSSGWYTPQHVLRCSKMYMVFKKM